jgi:hypothetical protein
MRREVLLRGGPLDGTRRDVDTAARRITVSWEEGSAQRIWGDMVVEAVRLGLATYRRVDATTFEHCRTPTGVGDHDLTLPEQQLRLEDG